MPYKKICGVYQIINVINKKVYVGSAISIKNRWTQHNRLLKNNKHYNNHLQSSYNKHGQSNFIYEIIEIVDKDVLLEKEIFWIKKLNSNNNKQGYNKRLNASSNLGIKFSNETREKLRVSHLGNKQSNETIEKIKESQYKKICQFDKNGNFINSFESLIAGANSLGKNYTSSITLCIQRKIPSAFGYTWCLENDKNNFKPLLNKKRVKYYNKIKLEVTCLKSGDKWKFDSVRETHNILKISKSVLYSKLNNKHYKWKRI